MNVKHSSESNEHYTPPWIVEGCRSLMGGIDLDPASSKVANEVIVKADRYYDEEVNGFERDWVGRVFLNPPGGVADQDGCRVIRASKAKGTESCTVTGACGTPVPHKHERVGSSAVLWWRKLVDCWRCGHVPQACFVAFSVELFQMAQKMKKGQDPTICPLAFPTVVFKDRVDFVQIVDGEIVPQSSPTHASALIYLPPRGTTPASAAKTLNRVFNGYGFISVQRGSR